MGQAGIQQGVPIEKLKMTRNSHLQRKQTPPIYIHTSCCSVVIVDISLCRRALLP